MTEHTLSSWGEKLKLENRGLNRENPTGKAERILKAESLSPELTSLQVRKEKEKRELERNKRRNRQESAEARRGDTGEVLAITVKNVRGREAQLPPKR